MSIPLKRRCKEAIATTSIDNIQKIPLYPVLSTELLTETPVIEVYIDEIKNPKHTSNVIIELNTLVPISELNHLKRVKGCDIILFPVNVCKSQYKVHRFLKRCNFNVSYLKNAVRVALVAAVPPQTYKQYSNISKLWPCNFHKDAYLENLFSNRFFTQDELLKHKTYMYLAKDIALFANTADSSKKVGAVIVDPETDSVIAVGYNRCKENPCRHALMVAIDNIANIQRADPHKTFQNSNQNCENVFVNIASSSAEDIINKYRVLKFGTSAISFKSENFYLCTGFYAYVTEEPCIMCAMALVHSRMKRVFYSLQNLKGGLETICKIHTINELNHHYEVFGGVLQDECKDLL